MCVFGGGAAYGKGGVSLSGNGWVGPERRKERDKKKRTRIKMSSTQSFAERKQPYLHLGDRECQTTCSVLSFFFSSQNYLTPPSSRDF